MRIKKILLIDDNEADRFLNEIIIEKYNHDIEVLKAVDGQDAMQSLCTMDTKPDLILLDINMPGLNGFEFVDEYSKNKELGVPIAMLSSSDQDQDKQKAISYDCVCAYFPKPLCHDKLREIEQLL